VNNRDIDALRAVAILGVVLANWFFSAVVADSYRISQVHGENPLSYAQWLVPFSWLLQTVGLFFFAGGYAAAKGLPRRRLVRPVLPLALVWVPALLLLAAAGAPNSTRHLVESLVTQPLRYLLAYLVLTALTPLLVKVGPWLIVPAIVLVALSDAFGWAVPYLLGIALARHRLGRGAGSLLLGLGVAGGATLVAAFGVDPPSLFAVALASAQIGLFLLVRPELTQILNHSIASEPVARLNLVAVTIFVWHQTALLLVTFAGLLAGRPAGLLDTPDGRWPLDRLRWLPVFALVLVVLVSIFHRFEVPGSKMSYGAGTIVESDADHQRREEGRT